MIHEYRNDIHPQNIEPSKVVHHIGSPTTPISSKDVAIGLRFLHQMRVPQMFAKFSDTRDQKKITYSGTSLALWGFSACFFRQGSKNALNSTLKGLKGRAKAGMAAFLNIENHDRLPDSSTVDDYLRNIPVEEFNETLLQIFEQCNRNKLFYNHAETLLPGNSYSIGCDGFHTHTYTKPHAVDEDGNNVCPYCLPRTRNAGTPEEKTYWVHTFVTFVLVFPNSLKIPIYIYPLKAQQVDTSKGDEALKQECELIAAHAVLPLIRSRFPRTAFLFLGDALYANEPFIRLCDELNMDYSIVRKEKVLKKLRNHCDELAKTELYQKKYNYTEICMKKKLKIVKTASWFNNEAIGKKTYTNVLRFEESHIQQNGEEHIVYKGEWLSKKAISKSNCLFRAQSSRMRWEHEDFHNTAKNRGFDAKHDMARSDPHLCLVWKMIFFIAFAIFELFRCTVLAKAACGKRSWMKFAKDMLQQLVEVAWDVIANSEILTKSRIQFRYDFQQPP